MRFCWAQYSLWAVIALLGLLSILSGCGARGPLELPPDVQARIAEEKRQLAATQLRERQQNEANLALMQAHFDTAYPAIAAMEANTPARAEALARLYAQLRDDAMQPLEAAENVEEEASTPLQRLTIFKRLLVRMQQELDGRRREKQTQEMVLEKSAAPGEGQPNAETPPPPVTDITEAAQEAPAAPPLSEEEIAARIALIGELIRRVDAEIGGLYLHDSPLNQQAE